MRDEIKYILWCCYGYIGEWDSLEEVKEHLKYAEENNMSWILQEAFVIKRIIKDERINI